MQCVATGEKLPNSSKQAKQGNEVAFAAKHLVVKSLIVVCGAEYPTKAEIQTIGRHNFRESGWLSTSNIQQMKAAPGVEMCAPANFSLLRLTPRVRQMYHSSDLHMYPLEYGTGEWRPWDNSHLNIPDTLPDFDEGLAEEADSVKEEPMESKYEDRHFPL